MKIRVTMDVADHHINEVVEGVTAEEIVSIAKSKLAKELGWKGLFLKALSPLSFAQQAIGQYNSSSGTQYKIPQSCDEFLNLGQDLGYITFLTD